ncbi:ABC transporter permease [Zhouia sp. PK063]|uniref:ABC transporter permease n=1 Tax=Zhouia sp. PK063 TaxID=3373602 RepID=UPI003797F0BE
MIWNFIKTAWRNLTKGRSFSLINIIGLAVGIACAALIFLWVEYHLTFNTSIPELGTIYEVKNNQTYGKDKYTFGATPFRTKATLEQEFPGVKNVSRFNDATVTMSLEDKNLTQHGAYVDPGFIKMFGLHILQGDAHHTLNDVSEIAISEKLAHTYFGTTNVIGNTVLVDKQPYKVTAVYQDIPENVFLKGNDFLLPFQVFYQAYKQWDSWGNNSCETWVQLNSAANFTTVNTKLQKLIKEKDPNNSNVLFLYPLQREVLYGSFTNGKEDTSKGKIQYIKMFSVIAFIILIIACINFMNLSTARSEKRAKEIGLHKVLGSTRNTLIGRLLLESLIVAYIAVVLALIIVACVLPLFNTLIGIHLHLHLLHPSHLLFLAAVGAVCGLAAGSYPALYLSSFNPIRALKSQITGKAGGVSMVRRVLVVLQFTVSVVIIIAVLVIYRQIQFTKNRDLGFTKNNVLYVPVTPELMNGYASLKQRISQLHDVSAVSLGTSSPLHMYSNGGGFNWEGKDDTQDLLVTYVRTDADYLKTFDIPLQSGKGFSDDPKVDSMHVIINESLAKIMGKAGHVGSKIWWGHNRQYAMTITGITKPFVYNNINEVNAAPLAFFNTPTNCNFIYVKLKATSNLNGTLTKLQDIFTSIDASQPFDYHFVDQDFDRKFTSQKFIGSLATIFGCLSIFISCLGIFGLASFVVEQRKKEIGVRKVLGASVFKLWQMLSKEFAWLVIISCCIAVPLARYYLNEWLEQYDYRIVISYWIFIIAGFGALAITILTISFQSIKAAIANPIKSLRTE